MFTVILALIHSRSTNHAFKPEGVYFGTMIIDIVLIVSYFLAIHTF